MKTIIDCEAKRELRGKTLMALTRHPNNKVASAAILALGRIADPAAVETLIELLKSSNRDVRILAAFSLGQVGGEIATRALNQNTEMHKESDVTGAVLLAYARVGGSSALEKFSKILSGSKDTTILSSAAEGLGILWSQDTAQWPVPDGLLSKLANLAMQKEAFAVRAAFALARFKGKWDGLSPIELSDAAARAADPAAKAYLMRALGKQRSGVALNTLVRELGLATNSDNVKIEAAKGIGNQDFTEAAATALSTALVGGTSALTVTVLDTIASFDLGATKLAPNVEGLLKADGSLWVKASALKCLARIQPTLARQYAEQVWSDLKSTVQMKAAAAYTLARIGGDSELDLLAEWLARAETLVVIEAIDGLTAHKDEKMTDGLRVQLRRLLERADVGITSQIATLVEQFRWRDFAPVLATIYRFFNSIDHVEAKVAILNALAAAGDSSNLDVIQFAMKEEKEKNVVTAAVKAYQAIAGKNESKLIPLNSIYTPPIPSGEEIKSATMRKVAVITSRGEIQIQLLPQAPLTATTFLRLVKDGFYAQKTFHRVVPNFVAQGGDPRGDGFGGPGFLIRDDVSPETHLRGTVGIATAGKDTGGCQFFFNLSPNFHLDGTYTVFAKIVKGLEVADKLEVGDRIISAKIL